ncbi:MAG: hypothetical protein M3Y41_04495 [Pseudomonadota bacterium]|nr:hypothetical protein [Pseudomonadota bacterium]
MDAAEFRAALARLGVSPSGLGAMLGVLDPAKPAADHARETYRLASLPPGRTIPAAMRALVALLERVQPPEWRTEPSPRATCTKAWLKALAKALNAPE